MPDTILSPEQLNALAAAVAERLADRLAPTATLPLLLAQRQAREFCGLGRTSWFEARSAGLIPEPVTVNGQQLWRRGDLERWAERLRPGRTRRRAAAAEGEAGP
jgi:hypothetical protein